MCRFEACRQSAVNQNQRPGLISAEGKSWNSPQWRDWWWVWHCSAPPPRWPPPPCSAPPPEEEGLCRSPSPTDAATPTELLLFNNNTIHTEHMHRYLDFWDGDSCFWVFIQHLLNQLLQLLSYDRPRREITPLLLNMSLHRLLLLIRCKLKQNPAHLASLRLLTCLETPHLCSWSCCAERRRTHRRRDTVEGQIKTKKLSNDAGLLPGVHLSVFFAHPSKDKAVEGDSHRPHVQRLANTRTGELISHTSDCFFSALTWPDAHLSAEALSFFIYHLRGHEGRRPRCARQESICALELLADAEIGDLDMAVITQQQVGWFDVPVDDLVVVHWGFKEDLASHPHDLKCIFTDTKRSDLQYSIPRSTSLK